MHARNYSTAVNVRVSYMVELGSTDASMSTATRGEL